MSVIVTGDIFRPDRDPTLCHQRHNIKWLEKQCQIGLKSFKTIYPMNPLSSENWLLLDQIRPNPIMKDFIMPDDIVVGFELPRSVVAWLKQEEIMYVDIIVSPLRFTKKRILGIESNILNPVCISYYELNDAAKEHPDTHNSSTPYKLIIGQTDIDRSLVDDNGILRKLDDYVDRFDFNNTYKYKPHPLQVDNIPRFVKENNIEVLKDIDTYTLLWDNNLDELISISSSVTYEAPFFNTAATRFIDRKLERYKNVYEFDFFNTIIKELNH